MGSQQLYFRLASFGLALAVFLGAFGAHGLKGHVEERHLATFETAVRYQFYGCLGMQLACVARCSAVGALRLLLLGILVFCGSLYLIVFTGVRGFGAVAPIGGLCLMASWAWLAVAKYENSALTSEAIGGEE